MGPMPWIMVFVLSLGMYFSLLIILNTQFYKILLINQALKTKKINFWLWY